MYDTPRSYKIQIQHVFGQRYQDLNPRFAFASDARHRAATLARDNGRMGFPVPRFRVVPSDDPVNQTLGSQGWQHIHELERQALTRLIDRALPSETTGIRAACAAYASARAAYCALPYERQFWDAIASGWRDETV